MKHAVPFSCAYFVSLLCIGCASYQQVLVSELHVHGGAHVLEVVRAVGRSARHLVRLAQQPHRGLQDSHFKPTFFDHITCL